MQKTVLVMAAGALLLTVFNLQNPGNAEIKFLSWQFSQVPLIVVIVGAFSLGVILTVLMGISQAMGMKKTIKRLEHELSLVGIKVPAAAEAVKQPVAVKAPEKKAAAETPVKAVISKEEVPIVPAKTVGKTEPVAAPLKEEKPIVAEQASDVFEPEELSDKIDKNKIKELLEKEAMKPVAVSEPVMYSKA